MGYKLVFAAQDLMPPALSSGERCVVLAIARTVKDDTGEGWVAASVLEQRAGLGTAAVAKALRRLRDRGYELRVPTGKDKNGDATYAHRGQSRVYRIPSDWRPLEGERAPHRDTFPSSYPQERAPQEDTFTEKGLPTGTERCPSREGKGSPQGHPGVHGGTRSQSVSAAVEHLAERLSVGLTDAETAWDDIAGRMAGPIRSPAAVVRAIPDHELDRYRSNGGPRIGTRHAHDCVCHGSGLEENDNGMPTGRACPRLQEESA